MRRADPDVEGLQTVLDAKRPVQCDKLAYTVKEACAAIGVCHVTLYRLLGDGELEAVKVGRRTLILRDSLQALIDNAPRFQSKNHAPQT